MKDYSQGKIYRIIAIPDANHPCYVGSTTKYYLSQRFSKHKSTFKIWKKDHSRIGKSMSYELFEKFGVDNCKIVLLETVNVSNIEQLRQREQYYIETLNCVNKCAAYLTEEQKMMWRKQYYEQNKTHLNAKSNARKRKYRENPEYRKQEHEYDQRPTGESKSIFM